MKTIIVSVSTTWMVGKRGTGRPAGPEFPTVAPAGAGFGEVDLAWQDLEERVLVATMP